MVTILTAKEITSDDAPLFEQHTISRKDLRDPGRKLLKVATTLPESGKMLSYTCDVIYMTYSGMGQMLYTKNPTSEPQVAEVKTELIILVTAGTLHRFESSRTTTIVATRTEIIPDGHKLKETTHFVLSELSPQPPPSSA